MARKLRRRYLVVDQNVLSNKERLTDLVHRTRLNLQGLLIPDVAILEMAKSPCDAANSLFQFAQKCGPFLAELCVTPVSANLFQREAETGVAGASVVCRQMTDFLRKHLRTAASSLPEVDRFLGNLTPDLFAHASSEQMEHHRKMMKDGRSAFAPNKELRHAVQRGDVTPLVKDFVEYAPKLGMILCNSLGRKELRALREFVTEAVCVRVIGAYVIWLGWSRAMNHNSTKDGKDERNAFYDCHYIGYGSLCDGFETDDKHAKTVSEIVNQAFAQLQNQPETWWVAKRQELVGPADRQVGNESS